MDVIGGIAAATEGLRLVNELRKIDKELDKTDLKLRLIDLADRLLEAKSALQTAQETEFELRSEIKSLEDSQKLAKKLRDENGLLYETDGAENKVGEPYCNLCFATSKVLVRIRHHPATPGNHPYFKCDNCKTVINTGPRQPIGIALASKSKIFP